eukprot:COSAG01_NODE_54789_length_329_cov_2.595652_1_plen_48_part_01
MSLLSECAAVGRLAEQYVRLRFAAARMLSVLRRSSCASRDAAHGCSLS